MNRKSMIVFILWCSLCIGLVLFFIIHIIVINAQNNAAQQQISQSIQEMEAFYELIKIK